VSFVVEDSMFKSAHIFYSAHMYMLKSESRLKVDSELSSFSYTQRCHHVSR
jgi:hypothetical protein